MNSFLIPSMFLLEPGTLVLLFYSCTHQADSFVIFPFALFIYARRWMAMVLMEDHRSDYLALWHLRWCGWVGVEKRGGVYERKTGQSNPVAVRLGVRRIAYGR
jgi:hypothetical protein